MPFVLVNMAMTSDGKIATANRRVSSFGSRYDRRHLLELRTTADAVMAGARTVGAAGITLGPGPARYRRARLKKGLAEFNLRVVVSGSGNVDPEAEIFKHRFSPIILLTTRRVGARKLKALRELADEVKICGKTEIHFHRALRWLRQKWGIRRLLCEGGGELNDSLFRAGLVDELNLTICPKLFGGRQAPTVADGVGVLNLGQAATLRLKRMRRVGDELFLSYSIRRRSNTRVCSKFVPDFALPKCTRTVSTSHFES